MTYQHTQYNRILIWSAGTALVGLALMALATDLNPWVGFTFGLLAIFLVIFHALTVYVDGREVTLRFGFGWPRRSIPINEIRDVCIVESPPADGWGIRVIPNGVLYRIAGRTTVELQLTEGRLVRIGTDQPDELALAVEKAMIWRKKK
jgi:hypothetical protein